eukprot:4855918-Prymnesium_polylepis.1
MSLGCGYPVMLMRSFARAPCAHDSIRRSCVRTHPLGAKRRLSACTQGVSAMLGGDTGHFQ